MSAPSKPAPKGFISLDLKGVWHVHDPQLYFGAYQCWQRTDGKWIVVTPDLHGTVVAVHPNSKAAIEHAKNLAKLTKDE